MSRVLDPFRFVLIAVAGWMNQRQLQAMDFFKEEKRVLRQLGERRLRLTDDQRRRLAAKAKALGRKMLQEVATIVTRANVAGLASETDRGEVRRERQAEAGAAAQSPGTGGTGGPHGSGKSELGLPAHPGRPLELGVRIARSTIAAILQRHGMEPAPERSRKTTWKEFLMQQWELIVAADFFTIEAWTRRSLQRFVVLFFLELSERKVEIAGIAANVNGL